MDTTTYVLIGFGIIYFIRACMTSYRIGKRIESHNILENRIYTIERLLHIGVNETVGFDGYVFKEKTSAIQSIEKYLDVKYEKKTTEGGYVKVTNNKKKSK